MKVLKMPTNILCRIMEVLFLSHLHNLYRYCICISHSLSLHFGKMVRNFILLLLKLLECRNIDLYFANEDEAAGLLR